MTWWEVVIYLWLVTAVLVAVYYTGRNNQRHDETSREEAIRAQAYKDGRKSMLDQVISNSKGSLILDEWPDKPFSDEDFRRMFMGTWSAPEQHETKEGS